MTRSTAWARRAANRRITRRAVARRRLQQPGQQGRLVGGDAARRLAEIAPRRGLDPMRSGAEIDPVQVNREDLVLAEPVFQPQCQQQLLDLALQGALGGEEQVLGDLLGDGAAPLHDAPGAGVGHGGARQTN